MYAIPAEEVNNDWAVRDVFQGVVGLLAEEAIRTEASANIWRVESCHSPKGDPAVQPRSKVHPLYRRRDPILKISDATQCASHNVSKRMIAKRR